MFGGPHGVKKVSVDRSEVLGGSHAVKKVSVDRPNKKSVSQE